MSRSSTDVVRLAVWREADSWAAAAAHLNRHGLAAAVPPELAGRLGGLGYEVWAAA
jgi:hypothetical protein